MHVYAEAGEHSNATIHPGLLYGVYSYTEAGRILKVTRQRVARWAEGYSYPLRTGWGQSAPVLQSKEHHKGVLSFPELIELFFVREFTALGVALPHIRKTAEALATEFGPFPFTRVPVLVNGRELLVRETERILRRPDIGQIVFSFAEDFAQWVEPEEDMVRRYYPPEYRKVVYLDRTIRAGEPVVSEYAVPTRIIYDLWLKEQDTESVAEYYNLPVPVVEVAIRYEGELRLAA